MASKRLLRSVRMPGVSLISLALMSCAAEEPQSPLKLNAAAVGVDEEFAAVFCNYEANSLDDYICTRAAIYLFFQISDPAAVARIQNAMGSSEGTFKFSLNRSRARFDADAFIAVSDIAQYIEVADGMAWGFIPTSAFCGMDEILDVEPLALRILHERTPSNAVELVHLNVKSLSFDAAGELQTTPNPPLVTWSRDPAVCANVSFVRPACNIQVNGDWECNRELQTVEGIYFRAYDQLRKYVDYISAIDNERGTRTAWHADLRVTSPGEHYEIYCGSAELATEEIQRVQDDPYGTAGLIEPGRFSWAGCTDDDDREVVAPSSTVSVIHFTIDVVDPETGSTESFEFWSDRKQWLSWPR